MRMDDCLLSAIGRRRTLPEGVKVTDVFPKPREAGVLVTFDCTEAGYTPAEVCSKVQDHLQHNPLRSLLSFRQVSLLHIQALLMLYWTGQVDLVDCDRSKQTIHLF